MMTDEEKKYIDERLAEFVTHEAGHLRVELKSFVLDLFKQYNQRSQAERADWKIRNFNENYGMRASDLFRVYAARDSEETSRVKAWWEKVFSGINLEKELMTWLVGVDPAASADRTYLRFIDYPYRTHELTPERRREAQEILDKLHNRKEPENSEREGGTESSPSKLRDSFFNPDLGIPFGDEVSATTVVYMRRGEFQKLKDDVAILTHQRDLARKDMKSAYREVDASKELLVAKEAEAASIREQYRKDIQGPCKEYQRRISELEKQVVSGKEAATELRLQLKQAEGKCLEYQSDAAELKKKLEQDAEAILRAGLEIQRLKEELRKVG
jgi:hypothetical protein